MSVLPTQLRLVVKAMLFVALAVCASVGEAHAKRDYNSCSAENQRPCPALWKGPVCDAGLTVIGGRCKRCGGEGELACPALVKGPQCSGGRMKIDGRCYAVCGGPNQKACPTIKAGYPCRGNFEPNAQGFCKPCGGLNQSSCRVLKAGSVCQPGLGKFNGVCRPCGKQGQRACPALEAGSQCRQWTTARGGSCTPCGDRDQAACRITDKGDACKPGLKRALNGVCVIDVKEMLRQDALKRLDAVAAQIIPAATRAIASSEDGAYVAKIKDEDPSFADARADNNACGGRTDTWSVGVDGDVAFILGVEGEVGAAIRCADHAKGQKDFKWFAAGGYNGRLGFGGGAGLTFGFWRDDFDELRGKSHGYVFDVVQIVENATSGPLASLKKSLKALKSKKPGPSIAVGFWYEDYPKNHRCPSGGKWCPNFQGWTLSVGAGAGWDLGGKYVKSTTVQFCSADMKCAEGVWRGGGKTVTVTDQTKEGITVQIGDGEPVYYDRVLPAGRKYKADDGTIVRFRKNFTLLKLEDGGKSELRKTADLPSSGPSGKTRAARRSGSSASAIDTLGLWDFIAAGRTLTDEFVEQTDAYVVLRRHGTTRTRRYDKVGPNEYRNARGSTLRFVSDTRAVWISPDKRTVYRMSKRP